MKQQFSKRWYIALALLVMVSGTFLIKNKMGAKAAPVSGPVAVKAMQVVTKDTPIQSEFVGQVKAKNEVKIMSKVAGNIVAKMVNGGDIVHKGQPLFQIDNKQYQSSIHTARANLAKSQATLNNSQREVERYSKLAALKGVSQQTLDSYVAQAEENAAAVAADQATLQQAMENEQDTLILSPVDGRIDVNDVSMGSYAVAGSTVLATVSSVNPVWVQFTLSEGDYLKFVRSGNGALPESFRNHLQLVLTDGKAYSGVGHVEQIDRGIDGTTGTITIKAAFDNPQGMLLPGMFARVQVQESVRNNAMLIPQKAVKQVLDGTFVTVVTSDNKAEVRQVQLGEKVGDMWLVEAGLNSEDKVVIEGIDKAKQGSELQVTMVAPEGAAIPANQ